MKNSKLILSALIMLLCGTITAQAKPISDTMVVEQREKPKTKTDPLKKEPLYILDGVLVDSVQFSKVNPNDIESIKVLKGNEAVVFYGNKGLEGAIIVTTNKMKSAVTKKANP